MPTESLPQPPDVTQISDQLLNRLPVFLDTTWIELDDLRACVADRGSGENGIRTNTSIAFALAVWLHRHGRQAGALGARQQARFIQLVRYLVLGHRTGGGRCADGRPWGHEWQSAWWAAKLGLGGWLMGAQLPEELREGLRRLVSSEADRHLHRWAPTGLAADTKAEENAWDAEILAVALLVAPEAAQAPAWRDKLREFSMNVFSAPQDRLDNTEVDGRPVRQAVYTCNLHGDFTLENHGSYHFCYVASPLLSKAWAQLALRWAGEAPPQSLHHHVACVWQLARHLFREHRFAYVGGQDWARYTYGEYFIVPALSYLEQVVEDPGIRQIQRARLDFLASEALANTDGTFFGRRFTAGRLSGQYGKYESDTYACIALTLMLENLPAAPALQTRRTALPPMSADDGHVSPEAQLCFWHTPRMFFGFGWQHLGHDVPSLLLAPAGRDDMLEWREGNGIGKVQAWGERSTVGVRSMREHQRHLHISGRTATRDRKGRTLYETQLDIDVDLDASSVEIRCKVQAVSRLWLVRTSGVRLHIPNDMFNQLERHLRHAQGEQRVASMRTAPRQHSRPNRILRLWHRLRDKIGHPAGERRWLIPGSHVEIDGRLRIECRHAPHLVLRQPPQADDPWQSLWVDRLEAPRSRIRLNVPAGQTLLELTTRLTVL